MDRKRNYTFTVCFVCLGIVYLEYRLCQQAILSFTWHRSARKQFDLHRHEERTSKPLLEDLVSETGDIKADVDFLLDYAIIGHPKTATSFSNQWLQASPQIQSFKQEITLLSKGKPGELVKLLYGLPTYNIDTKRGYKYPRDIKSLTALHAISEHWKRTKLIVGLRHPVLWFESFYNFRARLNTKEMPDPRLLFGKCIPGSQGVCGDEARFHLHLSLLGKTKGSLEERLLLGGDAESSILFNHSMSLSNEVFLYEISQLYDNNRSRTDRYRKEMSTFLGLDSPLPPLPTSHRSKNHKYALDICEPKFDELRSSLMKIAKPASQWIRRFFLRSPNVTVSSRAYFEHLVERWMEDPCNRRLK